MRLLMQAEGLEPHSGQTSRSTATACTTPRMARWSTWRGARSPLGCLRTTACWDLGPEIYLIFRPDLCKLRQSAAQGFPAW